MAHTYEKLDENYNVVICPRNDVDGEITGKILLNLPAYFDENPEERIALGWIKCIEYDLNDVDYDKQTEYCVSGTRRIDEYTIEEYPIVLKKSEEYLAAEELQSNTFLRSPFIFTVHS